MGLPRQVARLQARVVELVGEVDRRAAYEDEGAVSVQSWFRERTRCDPGDASQTAAAGRRLRGLPRLAAAFAEGQVSWQHTVAITSAAVPQRFSAIQGMEDTLVELATHARPRDVRTAAARIRDAEDADGSDASPLPEAGPDPRRGLTLRESVDGLRELQGPLDPVTGEWLETLLEAFAEPDPADAQPDRRRTAAQRRHDAFHAMLTKIAAHPDTPSLQGARPHVLVMVDVATLTGVDCQATGPPRLRHTGETTPELARQLAADARVTAVQTMGPWRAVDVGRNHRTLPTWLREALQMIHGSCRGPVELDADTGICTWTSPSGRRRRTHPPPRR